MQADDSYKGYTAKEAIDAACRVGTLGAWEWLQDWNARQLDEEDAGPDER